MSCQVRPTPPLLYVAKEHWMKQNHNKSVELSKMVLAELFAQDAEAGKGHNLTHAVD
jgi:hypothetical protein